MQSEGRGGGEEWPWSLQELKVVGLAPKRDRRARAHSASRHSAFGHRRGRGRLRLGPVQLKNSKNLSFGHDHH